MNYWKTNLERLSSTQSELADFLDSVPLPPERYQIVPTQIDKPALKVRDGSGKEHWLCSRHDPWKEAFRLAQPYQKEPAYNLCFIGGGMWYHVLALMFGTQQTIQDVLVIDHDPVVARLVLEHVDLTQVLGNPHLHWFVQPESDQLRATMNDLMTGFVIDGLTIVEHAPTIALQPEAYAHSKSCIDDAMRAGQILMRTKSAMGGIIQENVLRNLPDLFTQPAASILSGQFSNIPAFIVGAGPSLDRNIDELARVHDRGLLMSVDTTYPILTAKGIQPHINVTADPTPYNLAHFQNVTSVGKGLLAFSPGIRPEILQRVAGYKAWYPLPTSRTILSLKTALGLPIYMRPGINVVQTAFNLAKLWGCNPIVLVGTDFSFDPAGGPTHASGAALCRTIRTIPGSHQMSVELLNSDKVDVFTPLMVPGNEGGMLPTSEFWYAYLRSLEADIQAFDGRVINATAGGAIIAGAEYRSLSSTIGELCTTSYLLYERIDNAIRLFIAPETDILSDFVQNSIQYMENAVKASSQGMEYVDELDRALQNPTLDRPQTDRLLKNIEAAHGDVNQHQKIYSVLDDAADFILQPFMKRSLRALGDPLLRANLDKSVKRYRDYFIHMNRLCADTLNLLIELEPRIPKSASLDAPDPNDFFFGGKFQI